MTRFVDNTITFPYRRSLGPVTGAFMTALTERRILGIRRGDDVLVPPMEWDPATGAELAPDLVEVGPAGTVTSLDLGAGPERAAPARPSVRVRVRRPRRRRHAAAPRGRRGLARRDARRPAGRAPVEGHARRSHQRPRVLRAGRDRRDRGRRHRPRRGAGRDAWTTWRRSRTGTRSRVERPRWSEASHDHRLIGLQCPTCARVYASGNGYCPVDALAARPRARGRPAHHRRRHELHDRHAGAVPGPDRDRAVRPPASSGSTAPTR